MGSDLNGSSRRRCGLDILDRSTVSSVDGVNDLALKHSSAKCRQTVVSPFCCKA